MVLKKPIYDGLKANLKTVNNSVRMKIFLTSHKHSEPQGSILGPLLFLVCASNINKVPDTWNPRITADDINLFYSHQNIKILFWTVNRELHKIFE